MEKHNQEYAIHKENELYHWGIKLGGKKEHHKYYERINLGSDSKPKYKYFYTKAEYDAYSRGKTGFTNKRSFVLAKNSITNIFANLFKPYKTSSQKDTNSEDKNDSNNSEKRKAFGPKTNARKKETQNESSEVVSKKVPFTKYSEKVKKLDKKKSEKIEKLDKKKSEKGKNFVEKSKDIVNRKIKSINTIVNDTIDNTKSKVTSKINKEKNRVLNMADYARNAISDAKNAIENTVNNKIGDAKTSINNKRKEFTKNGISFINSFIKKANDAAKNVNSSFNDFIEKNKDLSKVFKPISEKTSIQKSRDAVNPYFRSDKELFQKNCYSCSIAYDLRLKGVDVKAIPNIFKGLPLSEIASFYKTKNGLTSPKFDHLDFSDVYKTLDDTYKPYKNKEQDYEVAGKLKDSLISKILKKSNGKDSTGFISVDWYPSSAHIFNYEVHNGVVTFIDTQPDEKRIGNPDHEIDITEYLVKTTAMDKTNKEKTGLSGVYLLRTDNLEVDTERISFVTCPTDIADHGNYTADKNEQIAWVYLNMYNYYTKALEENKISKNELLHPAGKNKMSMTYSELEDICEEIIDTLDAYGAQSEIDDYMDWVDDLEYAKKLRH